MVNGIYFQVWPGCILLCDFILSEPSHFKGKTVLELGAGTGLVSVVLSNYAKHVISTGNYH